MGKAFTALIAATNTIANLGSPLLTILTYNQAFNDVAFPAENSFKGSITVLTQETKPNNGIIVYSTLEIVEAFRSVIK